MSAPTNARPLDAVRNEFNSPAVQDQLLLALPKHVDKARFTRVAMTTIAQNPDLLQCSRPSLFRSVLVCAQLGLLPDAVLGEAYIVPYKGNATLQIGYKGMLKLARQSGLISTVSTGIIHERDTFEWEDGLNPKFRVVPKLGDRGTPVAVYAIIHYKDGGFEYEVMTIDEIEAVRSRSPSANSPAWKTAFGEMARKTVLRRLLKKAPLATEVQRVIAVDEAREERGEVYSVSDDGAEILDRPTPAAPPPATSGKAKSRMAALAAQAERDESPDDGGDGESDDDLPD